MMADRRAALAGCNESNIDSGFTLESLLGMDDTRWSRPGALLSTD